MKKVAFFIIGATVGLIICFIFTYLSGFLFEYLGVQLYESESGQQRNFNIFLLVSIFSSLFCGVLFVKKA